MGAGYCCPFPGTEVRKRAQDKGYLKPVDYSEYVYGTTYFRTDELDFTDLESFKGYQNIQIEKVATGR